MKVQLDESLTLNEKLNSENKTENIQALKNDLRKTKELLQSEKEKTHTVQAMIEECRDKQRQAEQERDYALSHQKKVEIPVEKPVLYQKCGNCKQTAYLKAKEKYDMQREKLAGRYKTKTAMYEALMFLLYICLPVFPLHIILFLSFQISCLFTIPALLIEYRLFNRYLYFFLMGECIIPFLFCLSLLISTFLYHGLDGVCFLFLALQQFFCFPQVVL